MKKRVVLLLTCLFLWVSLIFAQDVPVGVVVAFKKGNSQELNRYLGDKVDLIIHNRTTNADKQTAEGTMANFFAENNTFAIIFCKRYNSDNLVNIVTFLIA